ncbi:hypothetical protein IFM89_000923 [Coptis chinensis]|uniref:Uncharacterized protein n=1 Tax=Coptis chinensis TaxID=261450 RepID=A0A835IKM6_9MAGN|nr:hypothetical protein IFM89_000923 [Coptis chinensis]
MDEIMAMSKISGPSVVTYRSDFLFKSYDLYVFYRLSWRIGTCSCFTQSLSIGFANITCYSIITRLSMGMEPICSQAFGARRWSLLGVTLQRTVLVLAFSCLPLILLWLSMKQLLLWCGQDPNLTSMASIYLTYSIPNLFAQALLHPLRST